MPRKVSPFSARRLMLLLAVLIASTAVVAAQSGRRGGVKSSAPPAPPVPTATEAQAKPQAPARIQLLVAVDEPSGFTRLPLTVPETVLETCVQRLGAAAKDVAAIAASRRMTRSEAVKAAKAETTRYLVWLEVRSEREDYGAEVSSQSDRVYILFTILEPGSAKVKKSGRVQPGKLGNVGVTVPTRGVVHSDYAIRETARQAADRILDAFQIGGWPR